MSAKDVFYRAMVYTRGERTPSFDGYVYRNREDAEASARDLMSRWTMMVDYDIVEIGPEAVRDLRLEIRNTPIIKGAGHRVQL